MAITATLNVPRYSPYPLSGPGRAGDAVPFNPEILHLPATFDHHPLLNPLLHRWLKSLLKKPRPTRTFARRTATGTPQTPPQLYFLGRQLSQVLDIEPLTLEAGQTEAHLYAELGQSGDRRVVVCHPELSERPRPEQRFVVLRTIYAHFQRFDSLISLAQNWNWGARYELLDLFHTWNQHNAIPILDQDWSGRDGQDCNLAGLSVWLNNLCQKYQSAALYDLRELQLGSSPFRRELELEANLFATRACGEETARSTLPLLYPEDFAVAQWNRVAVRLQQNHRQTDRSVN